MSDKLFIRLNDDEDPSLRSQFVNLEELKNVPVVEMPSSAQEYLVSVISERQNVEEITKCDIDYKVYRKNQSLFYDQEPLPPVSDKLKPTKEWQNIQIADFSDIRRYISRMRIEANGTKRVKKFHVKKDDLVWWRYIFHKFDPNLSMILGFTAIQIDAGLEKLIKLIKSTKPGESIDENLGRWIYASLSCLKQPLHSDTICIIRDLAKECRTVRSRIDPDGENAINLAIPLTLIICIVGHYFGQLDLADSLEYVSIL